MICPKCGYSEGNHVEAKQSDEEFFLEWWTPTIGEEAAKASWLDKVAMKSRVAPMVIPDIEGHISMADGQWVSSRSKHRENLKRNNCIEIGNEKQTVRPTSPPPGLKETLIQVAAEKLRYK